MNRHRLHHWCGCWFSAALLCPAAVWADASPAKPMQVIVCYPGGPVSAADAKPAMDSMLRVIEETGHFSKGSLDANFTSKVDECRKLLTEKNPPFAILSLGLYLEYRERFALVPVAQPNVEGRTTDVYRILVKKGAANSVEALKGKTLGGTHLSEPQFLAKVVFQGKVDPAAHFKLKPTKRALRALKDLNRGKLDSVIVNEQQWKSLGSLPYAASLQPVFTSEPIPLMGIVANSGKTTVDERARLTQALSAMCTHQKGKELCQLFGVESFVPAEAATYQRIVDLWQAK